jgi:hypothetical protein
VALAKGYLAGRGGEGGSPRGLGQALADLSKAIGEYPAAILWLKRLMGEGGLGIGGILGRAYLGPGPSEADWPELAGRLIGAFGISLRALARFHQEGVIASDRAGNVILCARRPPWGRRGQEWVSFRASPVPGGAFACLDRVGAPFYLPGEDPGLWVAGGPMEALMAKHEDGRRTVVAFPDGYGGRLWVEAFGKLPKALPGPPRGPGPGGGGPAGKGGGAPKEGGGEGPKAFPG